MTSSQFDNTVKNQHDKSLNTIILIMTKTVNYKLVLFSHFLFLNQPHLSIKVTTMKNRFMLRKEKFRQQN